MSRRNSPPRATRSRAWRAARNARRCAAAGRSACTAAKPSLDGRARARGRGRPDRAETPLVQRLRRALDEADLSSPPLEDIRQSIWSELAQNLWTSTLCTLTGCTVRELQDYPELKAVAGRAAEEAGAIARALGVALER